MNPNFTISLLEPTIQEVLMSTTFVNANSATLKVPGAKIYHEVQGEGPVLLMIPGGPADHVG
jgi:hypothetical protein